MINVVLKLNAMFHATRYMSNLIFNKASFQALC